MIVLDTCSAIAVHEGTPEGRAIQQLMLEGEEAIAPESMRLEMANTIWKMVRFAGKDPKQAAEMLEETLPLVDEYYPDEELLTEALNEGIRLKHPVYDMAFCVLARRTGATLVTLDAKLRKLAMENGVNCIDIVAFD